MRQYSAIILSLVMAFSAIHASAAEVKTPAPVNAELQMALNRLNDAGVFAEKRGSLTFFRWNSAQPPVLVKLGLWGAKIDNELLALVSMMPDLDGISLYETSVTDDGLAVLTKLGKLKSVAFLPVERYVKDGFGPTQWSYPFVPVRTDRTRISGKGLQALAAVKSIEALDLQDTAVQSGDLALLASWPKLGTLGLANAIDDETIKHLQACPKLRALTLGNREIAAAELRRLAQWPGLRSLTISAAKLSGEALSALAELKSVTAIELIDCGLTDEHLQHLAGLPPLEVLALSRNEINGPGLKHLSKLRIKSLGLEFNNIRDATLSELPQLTQVEGIRLSYCLGITDAGIQSGTLQGMSQLKELALRGIKKITDASIPALAQIKCLEHLNIRQNGITVEGCEQLKKAMPTTTVFK